MSSTSGISNMRAASIPNIVSGKGGQVSSHQKINSLFQKIDSSGSGRITKAQFEQAFNKLGLPSSIQDIGQDAAFRKLDPSGTGSVSKQDFIRGMQVLMTQKNTTVNKEISSEIKSTPASKIPASNPISQNQITNLHPQAASSSTGNTINITA
jgi:hypothetical protein